MRTEDGFILLADADELGAYLASAQVGRPIRRIQNHHTYIPGYAHFTGCNHFSLLRAMKRDHVVNRTWSDIGQSLTTFPDGTIAVCRPLAQVPAAIKGANTGAIALEHVGWFDAGKDAMTDAHQAIIVQANALLCQRFQLTPSVDSIVYHHWYDLNTGKRTDGTGITKSCPGTAFFGGNTVAAAEAHFLPLVRQALQDRQGQPAPAALRPIGAGRVAATALNVRDRPSAQGRVVDRLTRGDRVSWFAESSAYGSMAWLRIDAATERWVAEPFIQRD